MGLIGKGLLGLLLGGGSSHSNSMPSYLRNSSDSYSRKSSKVWWRCIYCGKMAQGGSIRPSASFGGRCTSSPYGTHYYEER